MNGSEHLDIQRIYDLLDGRLDSLAEGVAQAHLLRCERCRELECKCANVVESLRWYGSEPMESPAGYWDSFWDRWSPSAAEIEVVPLPVERKAAFRLAPVLAVAAALALLVGLWWSESYTPTATDELQTVQVPMLREAVANTDWAEDYARFERMTIAVGGINPVSRGIVLASLAQEP
jgi:hypothetical protein